MMAKSLAQQQEETEKQAHEIFQKLSDTISSKLSITELDKIKARCKYPPGSFLGIKEEELHRAKTVTKFIDLVKRKAHLVHFPVFDVLITFIREVNRSDILSDIVTAQDKILQLYKPAFFLIPDEIRGHQEQEAFRKAREEGSKEVHRTRLMIVGQERVGKTSLMRSLTRQSFNRNEPSTEGISASSDCSINIEYVRSWRLHKEGDDSTSLKHEYERGLAVEAGFNLQDLILKNVNLPPLSPGATMVPPYSQQKSPVPGSASPPKKTDTQQYHKDGKSSAHQEPLKLGIGASGRKRNVSGSTCEPIVLSFWDFAGQDLYYTTHQTFLSSRAIYVVVFNLCSDLDKPVPIPATSRPTDGSTSNTYNMTPLQYLDFWMRSIFTYTKENSSQKRLEQKSPPIFIVGTHRNSVGGKGLSDGERKGLLAEIFTRIRQEICNKPYFRYVVSNFYAIENSLDPDNEKIVKLREHIESTARKEPYMGQAIPLRWLEFDEKKLEVAKSDGLPVLTLKQVKDGFGVKNETELLTMLKFYHDLGHIIYFGGDGDKKSQALKDVIIRDPQWLIDAFKKVITVTSPRKQIKDHSQSWTRLKKDGILEDVLIDHMWKDRLPKKQALLDLMDKFDLLCERVDQHQEDDQSSSAESVEPQRLQRTKSQSTPEAVASYYVPSMLQRQASRNNKPKSIEQKHASVFFVDFHGFLPDGLFHRLVVRALRWSQKLGGTNPGLRYDRANFYIDDQHEFVLQLVHQKDLAYVKVSVMRVQVVQTRRRSKQEKKKVEKTPSTDVTDKVRIFVEENLQNLKDMWIKRIDYCLSVQCECKCKSELHFLPLDKCLTKQQVCCRFKNSQSLISTDKVKAMFNQDSSEDEPTALESKQPMSEIHLREIAQDLGGEWEKLATYLGFKEQDIYRFKSKSNAVDDQIFSMLVNWKKKRGKNVEKMRSELADALKKVENHDLAEKVMNY